MLNYSVVGNTKCDLTSPYKSKRLVAFVFGSASRHYGAFTVRFSARVRQEI